ncbi:unnamed protein product [Rangifer tarandus platyrhynchus]|uniref:Uncharacterized protein n=1 Tax=Rangifer tarandus platyrhynchus TaxID=3082113 RepID=A0AC59YNN2_RANTA
MTTGKSTALTRQTFVSKVMSLLFNMLSRFVIAFPPRSKCLLISWLQSLSTVILEHKKIEWFTLEANRDHSVVLRLHPSTAFCTLLLTLRATPFLLRDSCPQY